MKNKISLKYKFGLYYLFHLEHFLIKYHEQSTFLIIDCSEILTNYVLIYHNANIGGGGGYALIYIFTIICKMYNIIIGLENVGIGQRGLKSGIRE